MTDISKHFLLRRCYELMIAIERCPASEQQTKAITKAGELMADIEAYTDNIKALFDYEVPE